MMKYVFLNMFPDDIVIRINRVNKINCPRPQCQWASSNPLRITIELFLSGEKKNMPLCLTA